MSHEVKLGLIDNTGSNQEVDLSLESYREAEDNKLSLAQHINRKYPTNAEKNGTAFEQLMASAGLIMGEDRHFGIRPPTLEDVFAGRAGLDMSSVAIERPDGSKSSTPAGRLLFPAAMLEMVDAELRENLSGYNSTFMQMVAFTRSINSQKYEQVKIDSSRPRSARGQPIAQLAEPVRMLTIKTTDVSRSLPIYSIGLEISKQALQAATLDLIGLAVREHSAAERSAQLEDDFANVVNGDVDSGQDGLAAVTNTAVSYDPAITADHAGKGISQLAWLKYLRQGWSKRSIDWVVCDVDSYFALTNRWDRPTTMTVTGSDERINAVPEVVLPGVPGKVNVFITEGSPFGAKTLIGLDSSKALRRMVYVGADYSAVEDFVMRRSTAMRFDWGERIESAGYTDAFQVMTYT